MDSDRTAAPAPNPYLRFLAIGGMALLALGAVIGFSAKGNAEHQFRVQQLASTLVGGYFDSAPVAAAYGWMWFGVVIAVVGAILLVVWVSIKAAKSA